MNTVPTDRADPVDTDRLDDRMGAERTTTDRTTTDRGTADSADADTSGSNRAVGVLVMAYGTPRSTEDVAEYYTHIRHGRRPGEEQLADLVRRYLAVGGVSTMRQRTDDQVTAITNHLVDTSGSSTFRVQLGQKHAAPFVEDGIEALVLSGVDTIVGLVLAPHYSAASVGQYHDRARSALDELSPSTDYRPIDDWSTLDEFIGFTAAAVGRALAPMPERTTICFTAHSLPLRVLDGDPYRDRLAGSAAAIAAAAGIDDTHRVMTGWQSAGRTPEPWAGPDILQIIEDAAVDPEVDGLLVVPQGFTSDHLEVGYDLDIEARAAAERVGISLARTDMINADPTVMAALADLVMEKAR